MIQYILQHGQAHEKARMLGHIQGSLVQLAKNQYSSHVCEKAITYSTVKTRRQLIDEIMSTGNGEHSISVMMKDDFASGSVFDLRFSLTLFCSPRLCFAESIGGSRG